MKGHLYKVTVEHVEDMKGNATGAAPLVFEARNHDDLLKIVEAMKGKMALGEGDSTAFAIGLKLFGEVMLKNKDNELFQQFKPHLFELIKEIKKS